MAQHYSTLELFRHDDTARAPERDYDATAFELDGAALAPQAVPDEIPQVVYDSTLPEAHGQEESTEKRTSSLHITKPALKWPWIVIALLITVVVAVGVAFGVWTHRDHSSHTSSAVTSPPVAPTKQFILNDTSLAAVSDTNGNRYLFFQDTTGLIRGVKYTSNLNQWRTNLNLGTNSSAKKYTPLAATATYDEFQELEITVFYVSGRHTLNSSTFLGGQWNPDTQYGDLSSGNFRTAVDTRSLAIVRRVVEILTAEGLAEEYRSLLYYEDPTGKVLALSQQVVGAEKNSTIEWLNVTSQASGSLPVEFRNNPASVAEDGYSKTLYESLGTNTTLRTPFTCGANWTGYTVGAIFYAPRLDSPNNLEFQFVMEGYENGPAGPGNFSEFPDLNNASLFYSNLKTVQDYSLIHQSDIALFGMEHAIWINHTQPTILDPSFGVVPPNNTFPFPRLASTSLYGSTCTYLYHQINGTTFAEEQWDAVAGTWTSNYVTVSY